MINWKQFLQAILMFVIYLLVISFQSIPYLYFFFSGPVLTKYQEGTLNLIQWIKNQSTPLKDLLRLAREHTLYPFNYPYQHFQKFVSKIAYYPFVLVGLSFFGFKKLGKIDKKWFIFFVFILICFVFGNAKAEISQRLSLFIFTLPVFSILRSADKFILFLPFVVSFFIVYFLKSFVDNLKNINLKRIIYAFLIILFFSYPLPFFLGGFQTKLPKWESDQWSNLVKMPQYYKEIANYVNADKNYFKILSLPFSGQRGIGWVAYPGWRYIGADFTTLYFNNPVLSSINITSQYFYAEYFYKHPERFKDFFISTLRDRGVKYIIFNNDTSDSFKEPLKTIIDSDFKNNLRYIKSFGKLDLYQIDPSQELPVFFALKGDYALSEPSLIDCSGNYSCFEQLIEKQKGNFIKNDDLSLENPLIIFEKIRPVKYKIQIQNASEPFWLVFSDTFHKDWKIYENQESSNNFLFDLKYSLKKSLEFEHKIINDYANAWYIEPQKLDNQKDFDLIVYFLPQNIFYLGVGISGTTLLFWLICFLIIFRKKKNKSQDKALSQTIPPDLQKELFPPLNSTVAKFLIKVIQSKIDLLPKGSNILDCGCGFAWLPYMIYKKELNFFALDNNPKSRIVIEYYNRYENKRIKYVEHDLSSKLLFKDNSFSCIFLTDVIEYIPSKLCHKLISDIYRILKPNGFLFLTTPNKYHPYEYIKRLFPAPKTCSGGMNFSKKLVGFFEIPIEEEIPYPHVHMFSRRNVFALLKQHGFSKPIKFFSFCFLNPYILSFFNVLKLRKISKKLKFITNIDFYFSKIIPKSFKLDMFFYVQK